MAHFAFDLIDTRDIERRPTLDRFEGIPRNETPLALHFADRNFDLKPAMIPALIGPDRAHLFPRVPVEHGSAHRQEDVEHHWDSSAHLQEDVEHHQFSFEVKMRKVLPKFLKGCYEQAIRNCPKNRLPVVILKEKGKRYEDCLVIINFKDFISCVVKKEE